MNQYGSHDVWIGDKHFENADDLEEYCFYNPDFIEEVELHMRMRELRDSVEIYYAFCELEYGDGNKEHPFCFLNGKEDVLYDKDRGEVL